MERWLSNSEVEQLSHVASRSSMAERFKDKDVDEILRQTTYMSAKEWSILVREVFSELRIELEGTGVELGAGTAGLSNSVVNVCQKVEKIYAVELVPQIVELLQTQVTNAMGNEDKVIPVLGSFDKLELNDGSIDFIIEYDSLHHSDSLVKTMREANRILKKGGKLIAFDRVHYNTMKEVQREAQLSIEYSDSFKQEYGMPLETTFTRRDNGEHEYTENEWRDAFSKSGFRIETVTTIHRRSLRELINAAVSQMPYRLKRLNARLMPNMDRVPISFFGIYLKKRVGGSRSYVALDLEMTDPRVFRSKTVIVATKV